MPLTVQPPRGLAFLAALIVLVCAAVAVGEDEFRLSPSVEPTLQFVELRVDPARTDYRGSVRIEIQLHEPREHLWLHSRAHRIERAELRVGEETLVCAVGEQDEGERIRLTPSRPLAEGPVVLEIDFTADYDTRAQGLYRHKSGDHSYLFTQFESIDARGAFPCFDEPSFKIPWELTLEVPDGLLAVANTPAREESVVDGWRRTRFERTRPLPSYVLALAVGPFESVAIEGMDIPGRVICPAGQAHLAAEAVRVTPPLLRSLERYFDLPYPYEKLDLIAVPEFWPGAMENAGAITFRDTILLLDSEAVTVAQLRLLCSVTAHELAHMWFGDLVTMAWWDDLWLNESFATWLGDKTTDEVFPEYGIDVTTVQGSNAAMNTDAQLATRAIRQPVEALSNLLQTADVLAYQKGAAVLGMFESYLGEDLFREGVRHYIRSNAEGNAVANDLWEALGSATGVDVGAAMSTFVDQPGVPLVRATILGDGKVELSQERFLNYGSERPEPQRWQVPVVLRWSDGEQTRTERLLLDEETRVLDLPGGKRPVWLHPNAGEAGYYRWGVDTPLLLDLAERADQDLDLRERVGLVGQLTAQLDAGALHGDDYLKAMEHLALDPRPEVITATLGSMALVRFAFVAPEQEELFARFLRKRLRPVLDRYGMEPSEGEDEAINLARPALLRWLGDYGQDPEVRAFARAQAERYLQDPSSIDPSLAGICLNLAATEGDWKLFNQLKQRFESAETPSERQRFLGALGNFRQPAMAKAALRYALEGPTRPQELFTVPMGIAQAPSQLDLLWEWFERSYEDIRGKIPEMFAIYLPYFAMGCDEQRLEVARVFFSDPDHQVLGQEKEMAKVEEAVLDCVGLRQRESEAVAGYLRSAVD